MSARSRSILCWLLLAALSGGIGWLLDRSMPVGPRWELGPEYDFPLAEYAAGRGIWLRSFEEGIALHDLDRGTHRCFHLKVPPDFRYLPSPDGRYLAVVLQDGSNTLYVLDAQNQTLHQRNVPGLEQQLGRVDITEHIIFSARGEWLYLPTTRELCGSTLAVLATVPAEQDEILHVAFEGEGPRLRVWLKNPHRALAWDPSTQVWERCSDDGEFRAASYDGRYVLLQDRAKDWKLHNLRTGTTQHLDRSAQNLNFALDSSFLIESDELTSEVSSQVNYRIWSIARGEWSKPFVLSESRSGLRLAPDHQTIVASSKGKVDVISFNSGQLMVRAAGRVLCFSSDSAKIALTGINLAGIVGRATWLELHKGGVCSSVEFAPFGGFATVQLLRGKTVLIDSYAVAWPNWIVDWLERVGWNLPTHSTRCINLETGEGFPVSISATAPTSFVMIESQTMLLTLSHRLQPMIDASPHFYAQNLTSGGIACYALEPGPRWGYLLGVPAVCLTPFALWHLWRRRGAIKPATAGGSNPPSSDSLPTQGREDTGMRDGA